MDKNKGYEMKYLDNGDVHSSVEYPEKDIEISVNGEKVIIGKQPPYNVVNIINKDKISVLIKYLTEQYEMLMQRLVKAEETVKETEGFDVPELKERFDKIPQEKLNSKKLSALNDVAQRVLMRTEAEKTIGVLKDNIDKILDQIVFLKGKP
jgi:hypothetical protein